MRKLEPRFEGAESIVEGGYEPHLLDPERGRLTFLLSEYFRLVGFTDLKARLPGFTPTALLRGTIGNHRPDLSCRRQDAVRTPMLLEVVTASNVADPMADYRWSLFDFSAKDLGAQLHFAVPRWSAGPSVERALRQRLKQLDIQPAQVWLL